jgi:hypothetical protein
MAVSRLIHWFIRTGSTSVGGDLPVQLWPYVDVPDERTVTTLSEFTIQTAEVVGKKRREASSLLISQYLRCIGDMAAANGTNSSGLLVHVDDSGRLSFRAIPDLADLSLTPEVLIRREQEALRERQAELTREYQLTLEKALDRGHGMSM